MSSQRVFSCLVALTLLAPSISGANGGGYRYGVNFTGSLAPFQPEGTENVQIVEENLDINLGGDAARVSVRYRMKNLTDKAVSVRFGFPVEFVSGEDMGNGRFYEIPDEEKKEKPGTEKEAVKYCQNYQVQADGKQVEFNYQAEPFASGKIKPFPGSDALKGIQGWMVTELDFGKGQEREISITYDSQYDMEELFVSDDSYRSPATFRYRLSTGGVWGGPIKKGTVTVSADSIPTDEVVIKSPAGNFRRAGKNWQWTFENLEPTLEDDLVIDAIPGWKQYIRFDSSDKPFGFKERMGVWSKIHQEYSATASSSLKPHKTITYGPENISNRDWDPDLEDEAFRTWCEGAEGDGIGEFLEITPKEAAPLTSLIIQNGYGKNDDVFANNNRAKTVTVTLNGEHSFDAELEDNSFNQPIYIRGYNKPVSKVRITLKEVYRGKKFRDTCISNVDLATRLEKEPEVTGAR